MDIILPRVLQCSRFIVKSSATQRRIVKDYEFDYYVGKTRDIRIDGIAYKVVPGTLVFRRPGQITEGFGDYDCYILSLDFEKSSRFSPQTFLRHRKDAPQSSDAAPFLADFPPVHIPHLQAEIRALYELLVSCSYPNLVQPALQAGYVEELLLLLLASAKHVNRKLSASSQQPKGYIPQLCSYINQHYREKITAQQLSAQVSLNQNYLIRIFKQQLNMTPNEYIQQPRLFYARELLLNSQLPVQEIADACGFQSCAYFSKVFKAHTQTTPTEYRKSMGVFPASAP